MRHQRSPGLTQRAHSALLSSCGYPEDETGVGFEDVNFFSGQKRNRKWAHGELP